MEGSTPERAVRALDAVVQSWMDRHGLTQAEARIARELVRGLGNKEIAHRLGVSIATVRTQAAAVFRKTATDSRGRLAFLAFRESAATGDGDGTEAS